MLVNHPGGFTDNVNYVVNIPMLKNPASDSSLMATLKLVRFNAGELFPTVVSSYELVNHAQVQTNTVNTMTANMAVVSGNKA